MENIIGLHVKYFDYLGLERFGRICYSEPSNMQPDTIYVYIEDEDPEFNIHSIMTCDGEVRYAEIRTNEEVYLDEHINI